jgi:hypothetical protein
MCKRILTFGDEKLKYVTAKAPNFPSHVTATMCERNAINFLRTGRMCDRAVMQVHELVDMCERISSTFKFMNLKVDEKLACANRP